MRPRILIEFSSYLNFRHRNVEDTMCVNLQYWLLPSSAAWYILWSHIILWQIFRSIDFFTHFNTLLGNYFQATVRLYSSRVNLCHIYQRIVLWQPPKLSELVIAWLWTGATNTLRCFIKKVCLTLSSKQSFTSAFTLEASTPSLAVIWFIMPFI